MENPLSSSSLAWQDTERFQARSRELERKLSAKEQELERLNQKQRRVGYRGGFVGPRLFHFVSPLPHALYQCSQISNLPQGDLRVCMCLHLKSPQGWLYPHMHVIASLGRLRQEDCEF